MRYVDRARFDAYEAVGTLTALLSFKPRRFDLVSKLDVLAICR